MDTTEYLLDRSKRKNKKLALTINKPDGNIKTVNFGDPLYADYSEHK